MFFENQREIFLRQDKACKWIETHYSEVNNQVMSEEKKALAVLILNQKTVMFLAEHDPKALEQAQKVLLKMVKNDS